MIGAPTAAAEPSISMFTHAAIQALHDAIAHEPDPQDKQTLGQALQLVLRVQAKNAQQAQQQQAGPQQAQQQAGPPAQPAGGGMALLQRLLGQ
jgi:hypothetical protein